MSDDPIEQFKAALYDDVVELRKRGRKKGRGKPQQLGRDHNRNRKKERDLERRRERDKKYGIGEDVAENDFEEDAVDPPNQGKDPSPDLVKEDKPDPAEVKARQEIDEALRQIEDRLKELAHLSNADAAEHSTTTTLAGAQRTKIATAAIDLLQKDLAILKLSLATLEQQLDDAKKELIKTFTSLEARVAKAIKVAPADDPEIESLSTYASTCGRDVGNPVPGRHRDAAQAP